MKKIIKGKVYDTDTAKELYTGGSPLPRRDYGYFEETIYIKKTGEFFLYGRGNAASKYAVSCGMNEWSGGSKIIPLTVEKAREWVEKNADTETYESLFGEIAEDTSRTTLTIGIAADAAAKIKRAAQEAGLTVGDYIASKCV